MTTTPEPGHTTPAEIEREIGEERRRLADTSEALRDRLSAGALLDEALARGQAQGGEIAAAVGRAMRDNPVPLAMIGAGVAWMLASGGGHRGSLGTMSAYGGPRARHLGTPGPGPSGIPRHGVDWDAREDEDTGPAGASRDAAGTLDDLVERRPLVAGALALALGAAVGGLIPNSRAENRAMGAEAGRLRREAADTAAAEGAKARRVAGAAAGEARRQDLGGALDPDRR